MTQTGQADTGDYYQSPVLRHRAWSCSSLVKDKMIIKRAKVRHESPKSWFLLHNFSMT